MFYFDIGTNLIFLIYYRLVFKRYFGLLTRKLTGNFFFYFEKGKSYAFRLKIIVKRYNNVHTHTPTQILVITEINTTAGILVSRRSARIPAST